LQRATGSESCYNYPAIFSGFLAIGIPEEEILPRENIFTYAAWKAVGRIVKQGEHGVRIVSWVTVEGKSKDGKVVDSRIIPRTTTVFHISQTTAIDSDSNDSDSNNREGGRNNAD